MVAGAPRLPDERMVDAELDREVHAAPPPPDGIQRAVAAHSGGS
ncbi:hypothetical protein I553_3433 [Mycobacterium xenopi 4042]|nr:hypothetical protein I553_3433 [Mycobacterium xenopi 4042]